MESKCIRRRIKKGIIIAINLLIIQFNKYREEMIKNEREKDESFYCKN